MIYESKNPWGDRGDQAARPRGESKRAQGKQLRHVYTHAVACNTLELCLWVCSRLWWWVVFANLARTAAFLSGADVMLAAGHIDWLSVPINLHLVGDHIPQLTFCDWAHLVAAAVVQEYRLKVQERIMLHMLFVCLFFERRWEAHNPWTEESRKRAWLLEPSGHSRLAGKRTSLHLSSLSLSKLIVTVMTLVCRSSCLLSLILNVPLTFKNILPEKNLLIVDDFFHPSWWWFWWL